MSRAALDGLEILIHTTAPSRGVDDARYRALATAYLDFEPARRIDLQEETDIEYGGSDERQAAELRVGRRSGDTKDVPLSISSGQADRCSTTSQAWRPPPSPEPMTRSYVQQSFSPISSSLSAEAYQGHGDDSKDVSKHVLPRVNDVQQNSWHTPPSVVDDSQSTHGRLLPDFASPGQALEVFLQHCDSRLPILSTSPGPSTVPSLHIRSVKLGIASRQNEVVVAETPVRQVEDHAHDVDVTCTTERASAINVTASSSFVVPDTAKAGEQRRSPVPIESECSSSLHSTSWIDSRILPTVRQASDTPCRARKDVVRKAANASTSSTKSARVSHGMKRTYEGTSEFESSIAIPSSDLQLPSSSPGTNQARHPLPFPPTPTRCGKRRKLRHAPDPDCIYAPVPRPSQIPSLTTAMLTPSPLLKLYGQVRPNGRYKPIRCSRDIRPLERGCWIFSTSAWSEDLRSSTWAFLTTFIGEGKAGWGVWCIRGGDADPATPRDSPTTEPGPVCWKVYCWGQIVEHVWQLLYTASGRKLKRGGARWIDAGGEAVIMMP